MQFKKLLLKLSLFTPLLFLLLLIDYAASTFIFLNKTEWTIAQSILSGNNVAFSFNYDDRMVQKFIINSSKSKKHTVVFGSSRSAKIDQSFFNNKTFFNNHVTGADMEGYMAMYQLYRDAKHVPSTIVIGLDPWIMDKHRESPKRWLSLQREFYRFCGNLSLLQEPATALWYYSVKLKNTFFIPHFQFSVKKIIQNMITGTKDGYFSTGDFEGFLPIVHTDGSVSESLKIRSLTAEEVALEINNHPNECPSGFNKSISQEKKILFTYFLDEVKKDNVKIIFFLPPFHPLTYRAVVDDPRCHFEIEAEAYFRQIAHDKGIEVVGSYDPAKYHLDNNAFYDSIHPKRSAVESVFKQEGIFGK